MYYLIVGPTCTGKDKIASYIIDNFEEIEIIKSTTSRPIRPNEKNGREYYFVSSDEFKKMLDEDALVEYRVYHTTVKGIPDTWYYGVEKKNASSEDTDYVVVIDYKGAMEFADYFGREKCILIYIKSLYHERYIRNILRGDFDQTEWTRRNREDSAWLSKAEESSDLIIENYGYDHPADPNGTNNRVDIKDQQRDQNKNSFKDTQTDIGRMIQYFSEINK